MVLVVSWLILMGAGAGAATHLFAVAAVLLSLVRLADYRRRRLEGS